MTLAIDRPDLSAFMKRHLVASVTNPDALTQLMGSMFAPYELRPTHRNGAFETSLASTTVRSIRVSNLHTRHESVGRAMEDSESYSISFALTGQTLTWVPGLKESLIAIGESGRILQRKAGTCTIDGDETNSLNLWVPREVLQAGLQQMVGDATERRVEFLPQISAANGGGATLRRTMQLALLELSDANPSFAHPAVAVRFEEFIVQTMLSGLPHNFSDFLASQNQAAAPRNVIRALDFIKAHASEPLTINQISAAAGCSTRALQLAFRAWRDTTPMKELNRIRLEYAHADLLKHGMEVTVTQIAMKWGFGHPGRFAQQYAQAMGQSPSQTQRFGMNTSHGVPVSMRALAPR
jgi:AraC-like DNA-binding protein